MKLLKYFLFVSVAFAQQPLQTPLTLYPSTAAGSAEVRLREAYVNSTTTRYIGLKAPTDVTTTTTFVLPDGGGAGGCVKSAAGTGIVQLSISSCDSLWTRNGAGFIYPTTTTDEVQITTGAVPSATGLGYIGTASLVFASGYFGQMRANSIFSADGADVVVNNTMKRRAAAGTVAIGTAASPFDEGRFTTVYMDACVGAGCGAGGLPVVDTTAIVTGSVDATKLMRFEVDGLTTATTRVLTPQNLDYVIASQNSDNVFSTQQSSIAGFKAAIAANTGYAAGNQVEIHRAATGEHFKFIHPQQNFMRLVTPGGDTMQSWDVATINPYSILNGSFYPDDTNTFDLGTSSFRWKKLWVVDIDCSGSCGSGSTLPVVDTTAVSKGSTDATKLLRFEVDGLTTATTRVLTPQNLDYVIASQNSDNVFSTQQSSIAGFKAAIAANTGYAAGNQVEIHRAATGEHFKFIHPQQNFMRLVTPGGDTMQSWDVATINPYSLLDGGFYPNITSTYNLGTPSLAWFTGYIDYAYVKGITAQAGFSPVRWYADQVPDATNTYGMGTTSLRYSKIWTVDLDISGTCTGCGGGGGLFTDGGATTYLTATADNLCIGCTSTSYKLDVSGAGRVQSNLDVTGIVSAGDSFLCDTDLGCNIGIDAGQTVYRRPSNIVAATSLAIGNASITNFFVSTGSLQVFNTSGVQKFVVGSSSGNTTSQGTIDAVGGMKVNGVSGITGTYTDTTSGCQLSISGGIITGKSC